MTGSLPHGDDPTTPDEAIDALAQRLYWKMEHLDPSDEPPWDCLNDRKKDHYRLLIGYVMQHRSLVYAALGISGNSPTTT
jgi:hypothetical protein